MFTEEINTKSDLVGENLSTKGDELYFQDLPIYNKLNISSAKVGEKTAKEPQNVAPPPRRQQSPWASTSTGSCTSYLRDQLYQPTTELLKLKT